MKLHKVEIMFDPRNLWVGLYWEKHFLSSGNFGVYVLYFCIIPTIPIRIKIVQRKGRR